LCSSIRLRICVQFVSFFLCSRAEQWPASVVDCQFYSVASCLCLTRYSGLSVLFSCYYCSPCFLHSVLGFSLRSAGRVSFSWFKFFDLPVLEPERTVSLLIILLIRRLSLFDSLWLVRCSAIVVSSFLLALVTHRSSARTCVKLSVWSHPVQGTSQSPFPLSVGVGTQRFSCSVGSIR
jgi:hypothetical protein